MLIPEDILLAPLCACLYLGFGGQIGEYSRETIPVFFSLAITIALKQLALTLK